MKLKVKVITTAIAFTAAILMPSSANAQYTTLNAHSHNDYKNDIPFWLAYYNHFGSVEADIWAVGDDLLVAHDKPDLKPENSLRALYIDPIVKLYRANGGRAWHDYPSSFQLIIELKSETDLTLTLLSSLLARYPDVFDPSVNENAVRIIITGNVPDPSDFYKYPSFIYFDGDVRVKYKPQELKRIYLYSNDLELFSSWKGERPMTENELNNLKQLVDSVHTAGKKIRFWNAPDNMLAWETLEKIGVDYINTDQINQLAGFLNKANTQK